MELKYKDGKLAMRGDAVIAQTSGGSAIVAGNVHELYERTGLLRVTGYALPVPARDAVLADVAYKAYVASLDEAEKAAAVKGAAEKAEMEKKPQEPHQSVEVQPTS